MSIIEPFAMPLTNAIACDHASRAWDQVCALWPTLSHLKATYPGFSAWYWTKVAPGLLDGTRHMLVSGSASCPSGIAILKRDGAENKICTVWVAEASRGRGIGRDLLEESIDWIGDKRPLFTVPTERFDEFSPLMKRLGFFETARLVSKYREGVVEHIFNGYQGTSSNR